MTTRMLQGIPVLAVAALLTACASSDPETSGSHDTADRSPQASTEMQRAVFQQMFEQGGTGNDTATRCAGIGSAPDLQAPSDALLAALNQASSVPVVDASQCSGGERASFNGQPAVLYGVDITECSATGNCMARGTYYSGNLGAQSHLYRVEQVNGEWRAHLEQLGPAS
ncbi:hypothetical protein SAMN05421848_3295 [Kushneria avicenniae]|uniref:Lipoprotein n=1 Tax=Kushneria avicenniae TaxID=402385 RepID=A0A1I1N879_9GAMM|nr:hypothetical protein [Kushneria avicenniae]SFC91678.1 hypothetical protein SAMN05421848_3295 [Kushneria avicenniae]